MRLWVDERLVISLVELNIICTVERFTLNLCISFNHIKTFVTLHPRIVWTTESASRNKVRQSSFVISNFFGHFYFNGNYPMEKFE